MKRLPLLLPAPPAVGFLHAPSAGDSRATDVPRAIVEVAPLANVVTRPAAFPNGRVPNGVAVTATRIWTGDAKTTMVFSIDRATLAADPTPPVPIDCPKTVFNYVADVMTIGGDVYALCASDTSGQLSRLAPETGARKS